MEKDGWWARFKSKVRGTSDNAASSTTASGEEFDEVHLPPGASTDDEPTSGTSNATDGDKKKKFGKSSEKSGEEADDKAKKDDTETDDAVVIVVDDDEDGEGDGDGDEDDPDEDEPETDDKNKSGGKGKSASRGKKDAPMDDKKNETAAPTTEAKTSTAPTPPATAAHPVLTAALAAGIDNEAKFAALQASAKVGEGALASARTEAKAAAVANFGQAHPDKIKAAEALVDGTNDLAQLNLLTENWHAGAPGSNRVQGANGSTKRQTRSNAPAAPGALAASTEKKPAADASAGGGNGSGNAPSGGNVYAQYNKTSR